MEPFITISADNSGMYFSLFFLLACLLCYATLLAFGLRNKYPAGLLFTMLAAGVMLFIIGYKLFAFSTVEWKLLFLDHQLPVTGKKTVLGGLAALVFGMWLSKKILGVNLSFFYPLGLVLPLAMAVQRFGCLMAGCCHGTPTALPWGIAYSPQSDAYIHQVEAGLLRGSENISLFIHPTQAYQVLFCLLIFAIVRKTRRMWRSADSVLLFSIILYLAARFIIEFFSASAGFLAATAFLGVSYLQWLILGGLSLLLFALARREFTILTLEMAPSIPPPAGVKCILVQVFMVLAWLSSGRFFSLLEQQAILLTLVPALFVSAWKLYRKLTLRRYRVAIPMLLLTSLLFMGQVRIPESDSLKVTYNEIGLGGMMSGYFADIKTFGGYRVSDCTDTKQPTWGDVGRRTYSNGLLGIKYATTTRKNKYDRFTFRASAFYSQDKVSGINDTYHATETSFGFNPYFQFDWKGVGFGVGLNLGSLRYASIDRKENGISIGEETNAIGEYTLMPQLHFRAGPYDWFFFEANLANYFPSSAPMPYFTVGLGTGLGRIDGTRLVAGVCDAGMYLEGVYPIRDRYVIQAFGTSNFRPGDEAKYALSLGFSYRLGFKSLPKVQKK